MPTLSNGITTATVELVTAVQLEQGTNRTVINPATALVQSGRPGPITGVLELLAADLAGALSALVVYCTAAAPAVTLTDAGSPLNGWVHTATGTPRVVSERAKPGTPAKYVLTVPFLKVA